MTRDEMLADIAYARTLAEEGRHAPLIGGSYLILFGALLGICYVAQWGALTGALPIPGNMIGAIWMAYGVAAFVGMFALRRRVSRVVWHTVMARSTAAASISASPQPHRPV